MRFSRLRISWRVSFLGSGEGFFQHFGDTAVAGLGGAVVKDAEQLVAALQGRHGLPTLIGARITGEGEFQDGRQVEFGFHGGHKLFGGLFGAAEASFRTLYLDDPIADPLAYRRRELVEPAAEGAVFVEDALEFWRDAGDVFCGVGYEAEVRGIAQERVGSGLHAFFDEHAVIALGSGKDRRAKGEAVDFALDADVAASSPDFRYVKGNADNNPAESRGDGIEDGFEGFRDGLKFWLGLHGEVLREKIAPWGRNAEIGNWEEKIPPRSAASEVEAARK